MLVANLSKILKKTFALIARDRLYYFAAVLFTLATVVYFAKLSIVEHLDLTMYGLFLSSQTSFAYKSFTLLYLLRVVLMRSKSPLRIIFSDLKALSSKPEIIIGLIFFLIITSTVFSAYTNIKSTIGWVRPFQYDQAFYELDLLLHGGVSPWVITHQLFKHPIWSFTINFFYNLWFFIIFFVFILIYLRNDHFRQQYLICYISTWLVIGGMSAIYLSSAGPCFVDEVLGVQWYQDLFEKLSTDNIWLEDKIGLPIWALSTQEMLWGSHAAKGATVGGGISAMPSMHVALATLMAIGGYAHSRLLGVIGVIYLFIIQVGSVHLGWHYAVDGYVSMILTTALWSLIGYLIKTLHKQRFTLTTSKAR